MKKSIYVATIEKEVGEDSCGASITDFDARDEWHPLDDELVPSIRIKDKNLSAVPYGDFETIHLDNNPLRYVRIGVGLPTTVKKRLVHYLKVNVDLFASSPREILGIDPSVTCRHLNINANALYISQRRRQQTTKKEESTTKTVQGLLDANFIFELKYTEWLSNMLLVKKSSGKWRICVDYIEINKICPKCWTWEFTHNRGWIVWFEKTRL